MPGDAWQKFANLRAYYAFMWGYPGKKLLFMGQEFAQGREWSEARGLDWEQLDLPPHRGVQALVRDLNRLYRDTPALHQRDCEGDGFEWISADDAENSVFSWLRKAPGQPPVAVICNFTPVPRPGYWVALPRGRALARDPQHRRRPLRRLRRRQHGRGDGGGRRERHGRSRDAAAARRSLAGTGNGAVKNPAPETGRGRVWWKRDRHRWRATRWPTCWRAAAAAG